MEKFVSCVTKEQCSAVIQRMVAEGCRPINPDHAWCSYSREVVIRKNNDKHISYANRQWYTDLGYGGRIITAHQYLNRTNKPILITRKGRVVTAEDKNSGEKAIATCCSTDTFDFGTGAMIAVARLIAQSDKGITKDAETVLRQLLGDDVNSDAPAEEEPKPFKVGSLVTLRPDVIPGNEYNGLTLQSGDMYNIACGKPIKVIRYDSGDQTYLCGAKGAERMWWYDSEMLEAWDEGKIREGDIVEVVNTGANYPCYTSWIDEYITDTALMRRFGYGNSPKRSVEKYEVVKIAPHGINDEMLAYIKPCSDTIGSCYIVGIRGLEKVTK